MGGFYFKNIFADVALIVIGLGGAKSGGKRGRGITTRQFHRTLGKKWAIFFSPFW